jgi:hypothetical protein
MLRCTFRLYILKTIGNFSLQILPGLEMLTAGSRERLQAPEVVTIRITVACEQWMNDVIRCFKALSTPSHAGSFRLYLGWVCETLRRAGSEETLNS